MIVQVLLDKGANANAQGREYKNALQAAASGGHDMIVQVLLDKGADANPHGGHQRNGRKLPRCWNALKGLKITWPWKHLET
jgi:ankyrin repeat protein